LVVAGKVLRAARVRTKTSAGGAQSLVSGPRSVAALAVVQRVSSMHKADAALRGNRPAPTTNSCIRSEDEGPPEAMLAISGADWFSGRGGTCRLHAI
jgi:hypothetical protein